MKIKKNKIYFAKTKEQGIVPTKRKEDAGYDIYPCFDDDYIVVHSLETKMIPTGIASVMVDDWYCQIQERGSTGSKGIKYGAGVIDSSYRGEWFVPITNTNKCDLVISKLTEEEYLSKFKSKKKIVFYPYDKAIAQFVILPVPKLKTEVIDYETLQSISTVRGNGALGSSGK